MLLTIGILISIIGTIFGFKHGFPVKEPLKEPDSLSINYLSDNDKKINKKIVKKSYIGLILIFIGFILQLIDSLNIPDNIWIFIKLIIIYGTP